MSQPKTLDIDKFSQELDVKLNSINISSEERKEDLIVLDPGILPYGTNYVPESKPQKVEIFRFKL